ncbi:MAG: hypothetical protein ACPGYT_00320 [Nitrospirales bacterium]
MIAKAFLSLAALLEALVLPYLLLTERYQGDVLGLVILHVMMSMAVGLLGKDSLPPKYQQSPKFVVVFFVGLTMFIPMFGAIAVLSLVVMTNYFFVGITKFDIQEVHESRFVGVGRAENQQLNSGDLQSRFSAKSVQTDARLDALGKLQGFETHQINSTVRGALQDQADDIRLVAFGILDKKEKAINARINQELELLQQAVDESEKLIHLRELAYAYWELVYKEIVEGDILLYALEQARHYNSSVLALMPQDAGMWALNGQISLRLQHNDEARESFTKALRYGIPETRVVPYLAELAFQRKEFEELSSLFHQRTMLSEVAILNPLLKYWNAHPVVTQESLTT